MGEQTPKTATSPETGSAPTFRVPTHVLWAFPERKAMPLTREITVGRDETCDFVLTGTEISRRHARFIVGSPTVAVKDYPSHNGVFVNGSKRSEAPLGVGDVVRCGEWIGVVVAGAGDVQVFRQIEPGWYGGAALAEVAESARRAARSGRSDLPIVIQGETGTGKEGLARAIHRWAGATRFHAIDCGTLDPELAMAELFGHGKGIFTSADRERTGLLRAASGGTLFLDEILSLPKAVQAMLLRALELRQVRPLGETKPVPFDVRIVVATQVALADATNRGLLRDDLYYRLDGPTIVVPPLRERREDIPALLIEFLHRSNGGTSNIEPKLVEALCLYDWPGNVRQLKQLAAKLTVDHGAERLRKVYLPAELRRASPTPAQPYASFSQSALPPASPAKAAKRSVHDEADREALRKALAEHDGNLTQAAKAVGMDRGRANRIRKEYPELWPLGLRR